MGGLAEETVDVVVYAVEKLAHEGDLLEVFGKLREEVGRSFLRLTDKIVGSGNHYFKVEEIVSDNGLGRGVGDSGGDVGNNTVKRLESPVESAPDGVVRLGFGVVVPGLDEIHNTSHFLGGLGDEVGYA